MGIPDKKPTATVFMSASTHLLIEIVNCQVFS